MQIRVDSTGTVAALATLLQELSSDPANRAFFILACDNNGFAPEQVDLVLRSQSKPVFGGVFPLLIHAGGTMEKGTIVVAFSSEAKVHAIHNLSSIDADYEESVELFSSLTTEAKAIMVLVDGFAKGISTFIESLYIVFGLDVNYFGGGAGSLSLKQAPSPRRCGSMMPNPLSARSMTTCA